MCGIIGFVGNEPAAPILLDGLERMEYRGYDSAGVAVRSETAGLQVRKTKGRLQVLSDLIHGGADLEGNLGIGHTRWATHGEPNDINAHPHVSENGRIALVHNGIIENYLEIKEHLMRQGVHFTSDTDTEVVAQLLEFHYNECHNMLEAVGRCLRRIEGSYAFGIICADYPNALIAARKDSPLIIGYGQNGNFIASDVTALVKYTRDVVYMDDGEVAVLGRDGVQVYNAMELPIEKEHHHIDWEISAAEKGGYEHFMMKEIYEQPASRFVANFIGKANFIDGIFKGRDGEAALVEIGGKTFSIPAPGKMEGVEVGGACCLTVRPESFLLTKDAGALPGTVSRATYYGAKIEYEVMLDEQPIIVEVYNPQLTERFSVGDTVTMSLIEGCVRVLK